MKVQISTERYEFSHGKKPRGIGYWFFKIFSKLDNMYNTEEVMMNGKLSDCIKQLKSEKKSIIKIVVLP
jgi:hypothetical protein